MAYLKNYKQWMKEKTFIHNRLLRKYVNEGDVVWAAVGENVGVEIDGKSQRYSRPVVVFKKHSAKCFTGIPLTTQANHFGNWYVHFEFQRKHEVAVLIQARLYDASRVYSRIGKLSKNDYEKIRAAFISLFESK